MTETLAIVGAVTGVAGLVIALLSFFRDRAKLVVTHSEGGRPTQEGGYEWYVNVFTANHGRQPIAITEAGLKQVRRSSTRRRLAKAPRSLLVVFFNTLNNAGVSEERLERWFDRIFKRAPFTFLTEQVWSALEEPILLGLGELRQYDLPAPAVSDLIHENERDIPIYAYAEDSYGRTILGRFPLEPRDDLSDSYDERRAAAVDE